MKVSCKENEGKWVALSRDNKVLGLSDNLSSLRQQIGKTDAVYTKVLSPDRVYAF